MQSLGPSFAAPDMLVDKMPGLPLDEPLAGIALIHLSRIVSSYLGLAAYEEVNEHANRPLDKILRGITVTKVDWVDFARPYYQVIYYCKALALEKLGRLDEAIRSAEGALKCDPDDGCVLSTLKALRKAQEVEKSKRDHASAKDVRRRQNKKRKALAKKARGIGFIPGVALL